VTIPAAPAAPSRYAAEAWQAAYDDLDGEIDKWARRLANNKDPLTVSERNRLRVLTEAVRNVTTISGETAQVAAYAIDTTNNAARTSLQASLNALPDHVLATVAEDAAELGWANVANRDAMGAIVQGRTGQLTADFTSLTKDVQTRLISGLQTGVALGEAPAKTAKRLRDSINDPVRFGQGRSVMIARTQLARAYDQTSRASYAIARQNGVVDAWEWQAFSSACPICGELDGQVFDIEMDTYRHPNCRCAILPVLTDSPKAKQKRFTGSDTLELQTSPSGWTHWGKKKGKGKAAKPKTPPKQPTAPTTVTPPPVTQGPRQVTSVDDPAVTKIFGPDDFHRSYAQQRFDRGDEYWWDEDANFAVHLDAERRIKKEMIPEFMDTARQAVTATRPHLPHDDDRTFMFSFSNRAKGDTRASTNIGGRVINVNPQLLDELADKKPGTPFFPEWSVSQGTRVPAEGVYRTLVHEIGHNADITLSVVTQAKKTLWQKWRYAGLETDERILVRAEAPSAYSKRTKRVVRYEGKDGPTGYARTDMSEMYAEAFVTWMERDKLDLGPLAREWIDEYAKMFGWEAV